MASSHQPFAQSATGKGGATPIGFKVEGLPALGGPSDGASTGFAPRLPTETGTAAASSTAKGSVPVPAPVLTSFGEKSKDEWVPGPLAPSALSTTLDADPVPFGHTAKLLEKSIPELLGWISAHSTSLKEDSIVLRPDAALSKLHPQPAAPEKACAETVSKRLGISVRFAGLVLRDWLSSKHSPGTAKTILSSERILDSEKHARELESFLQKTRRSAYACITKTFSLSAAARLREDNGDYSSVVGTHVLQVKEVLLPRTQTLVEAHASTARDALALVESGEIKWALESLFALCYVRGLPSVAFGSFVQVVLKSCSQAARQRYVPFRHISSEHQRSLFGDPSAIALLGSLFACGIGLVTEAGLLRVLDEYTDVSWAASFGAHSGTSIDQDLVTDLDARLMMDCPVPFVELVVLRAVWSGFSGCREMGESVSFDRLPHARFAAQHNYVRIVTDIYASLAGAELDHEVESWTRFLQGGVMHSQYVAFPPALHPRSIAEVEADAQCLAVVLDNGNSDAASVLSALVWDGEYARESKWPGCTALLRLAAALYPNRIEPLLTMLMCFCVDKDTAVEAASMMAKRLTSRSEDVQQYRTKLAPLSGDAAQDLQQRIDESADPALASFFTSMSMLHLADGSEGACLVEPSAPIETRYGDILPPYSSVGLLYDEQTCVAWACQWNGWEASRLAIQSLTGLLTHYDDFGLFSEATLQKLVLSCRLVLQLVGRIVVNASDDLRREIIHGEKFGEYAFSLLSATIDSSAPAWLRADLRMSLIESCISFMLALSKGDTELAGMVVERITEQSPRPNAFESLLSTYGADAFSVACSIVDIACVHQDPVPELAHTQPSVPTRVSHSHKDTELESPSMARLGALLQSVALPSWIATYDAIRPLGKSASVDWSLPTKALHMFRRLPKLAIGSASLISVLRTTLEAGAGSGEHLRPTEAPALRAALVEALHLSIALLGQKHGELSRPKAQNRDSEDSALSIYEHDESASQIEALLTEAKTVRSLALLASGVSPVCAEKVASSEHGGRHSFASESQLADVACIPDLAATCLAMVISYLYSFAKAASIPTPQLPWPPSVASTVESDPIGGQSINSGFARRITESKSVAALELLAAVASFGQRAASRDLLRPPTPGSAESVPSPTVSGEGDEAQDCEKEIRVTPAVIEALQHAITLWLKARDAGDSGTCAGLSNVVLSCVRVLRCSRELYGAEWLQQEWARLGVWGHLARLLACPSSVSESSQFCIRVAITGEKAGADVRVLGKSPMWTDSTVFHWGSAVDEAELWRLTVANVLSIFAADLSVHSTRLLGTSTRENAGDDAARAKENSDSGADGNVFDLPAFASLRQSFSEQWMTLFLDSSHVDFLVLGEHAAADLRTLPIDDMRKKLDSDFQEALSHRYPNGRAPRLEDFARTQTLHVGSRPSMFYCTERLGVVLTNAGVPEVTARDLLGRTMLLNAREARLRAQHELTQSFTFLTTLMIMADSASPTPSKTLTYASPQYGAKLCRVVAHVLSASCRSGIGSTSMLLVQEENAKLLGFISGRLSADELEQAALSSVRTELPLGCSGGDKIMDSTPVSRIAFVVQRYGNALRSNERTLSEERLIVSTLRWALLSGARLAPGPAFAVDRDIQTFADAALSSLAAAARVPEICTSVSVAVSAIVLTPGGVLHPVFTRLEALQEMFKAVDALSKEDSATSDVRIHAATSVALFLTKMSTGAARAGCPVLEDSLVLKQLCAGNFASMLPPMSSSIPLYSDDKTQRTFAHRLWCALLALSAALVAEVKPRSRPNAPRGRAIQHVVELAAIFAPRISRACASTASEPETERGVDQGQPRGPSRPGMTMAKIEETELAAEAIWSLSRHAADLRDAIPSATASLVATCIRITYDAYRLIRAEPIERWVRPVSEEERELSTAARGDGDSVYGPELSWLGPSSPWAYSPIVSPGPSPSAPSPRRSPKQALRAAMAGLGGRGGANSSVPPSPGMPSTPQHQSPMSVATWPRSSGHLTGHQSPLSPWSSTRYGLITRSGGLFGDEVSQAVLRMLVAALGALRRFWSTQETPWFAPTMGISEMEPSIGLLIGIQFHACNEIQRGAEGERRDAMLLLVENAMHLCLQHTVRFAKNGELPQGVRDELHKRLRTIVTRMRRIVPPAPSYSIIHSSELDDYLMYIKTT